MQSLKCSVLSVLLVFSVPVASTSQTFEEEDLALAYGDKSTISIATGSQQPISRAPAVASVITAHDIEATGATDLDQALKNIPGLHVSLNNIGQNPIYSFRGITTINNPQVLMLVNGIPITNVFWGDRSQIWGGMPLENVERIEVIRGPGSALYGADAFAGVINIITKTATDIKGTETGVRLGSFNSSDIWMQHGGRMGALDGAFYLRAGNTDGHRNIIQQDAQTTFDTMFSTNASLAPGSLNNERKTIDARTDLSLDVWRFRAAYQKRDIGIGALGGSIDPNGRGTASRLYLDASYEQTDWVPHWDMSAVVGYFDIKERPADYYTLFPAGAFGGAFPNGMLAGPGHSERHTHGSVAAVYNGSDQHRLRVGGGFRVEDLYEVTETKNFDATFAPLPGGLTDVTGDPGLVYMLPHKRNLTYVFAQDEWSLAKDWTLTAGVRHDRYSDFGGTTNPRLALVWDAAYNLVVKAMHGTAFRAPSFSEQHIINNPVAIGSSDIKPETIITDEMAFSWQTTSALQNNLNFFHYRMRGIILPTGVNYQNAGEQSGRGLELESTYDATSNLRLSGSYSLQHSTDTATGQDAGMAPHRRVFARAEWRFSPRWQLNTQINHVSDRMREPGDTRAQVPDYTLVDLTLRRDNIAEDWEFSAMVTNLFDRRAWEPTFRTVGMPSDLPLPGRALYLQLQYNN